MHAALLPRYQHFRKIGLELNNRLVKTLPTDAIHEGGKALGIMENGTLVFDTEDAVSVLMDFCLQDVRRQGQNAIERFLAKTPPAPDTDAMAFLQGARQAHYTVIAVEATEPGVGVHVRDLLRDETRFLFDVGFSQSAPVGAIVACRLMTIEGMTMTTGASLPMGVVPRSMQAAFLHDLLRVLGNTNGREFSPEETSARTGMLIRACLRAGAAKKVRYAEPRSAGRPRVGTWATAPAQRTGRNAPCRCGSGKKFKYCCGGARR